jgi:hypothetical protein
MISSIKDSLYAVAFAVFLVLIGLVKYLKNKLAKAEHKNAIFDRVEDIRAEQEIAKREIIDNEEKRIDTNVKEFKKVNKTKRDQLRNI